MADKDYCRMCPLAVREQAWGVGPKDAKLIVLGGFPSREDEKTGGSFTPGKSHTESAASSIRNIIRAIGLDPVKDVYWSYALKCNPFKRAAKPTNEHIKICHEANLMGELAEVTAEHVLVLGNLAAASVFMVPSPNIFEYRNKWHAVRLGGRQRQARVSFAPEQVQRMSLWNLDGDFERSKRWSPLGSCTWFFQQDIRALKEKLDDSAKSERV